MKNLSKLSLLFLAFLLLTSCAAPQPVSRLAPVAENSIWEQGAEFVQLSPQEDLYLELAFIRSTTQHLTFELIVRNRGKSPVLVTPDLFLLQPLGVDRRPLNIAALRAVDPEEILLDLSKRESSQVAEAANTRTLEIVDATLNLAEDVATAGKPRTPEEQAAEAAERTETQAYYDSERYRREVEMMSIQDQRDYWSNYVLRRTTLLPGYETRGLVLFPRYDQASLLEVRFPIEEKVFSAAFFQTLHHVRRP